MITNFNIGPESFLLIVLLIGVFVLTFKVMEIVFETMMVSALSGVFYLAMSFFFNYPLTLNKVLLFSFIGATLYVVYTFLATAYSITVPFVKLPFRVAGGIISSIKSMKSAHDTRRRRKSQKYLKNKVRKLEERIRDYEKKFERKKEVVEKDRSKDHISNEDHEKDDDLEEEESPGDEDVKEVVLKKVREDSEKDDEENRD